MEKRKLLEPSGYEKPLTSQMSQVKKNIKEKNIDNELLVKREEARKKAEERAKAKTFAKRQALAERIASATEELLAGVEESVASIEEISKTMEQLSSGAQESSSAAEESKAAVDQIMKSALHIQKLISTMVAETKNAQNQTTAMAMNIQALINMVEDTVRRNMESQKLITKLDEEAGKIEEIVQTVVMIADQTNLLALNAAIEAARAGEHGAGFAVVADEVRGLAEVSERAARDITEIVKDIKDSVKLVVNGINEIVENSKAQAETGAQVSQELKIITEKFDELVKHMMNSQDMFNEIVTLTKELLEVSNSIEEGAVQISSAALQSSSAIEEEAKAFEEVRSATQELVELAEELKTSTDTQKSADFVASSAEELSSNIAQLSSAAAEISAGINELSKGANTLADATNRAVNIVRILSEKATSLANTFETDEKLISEISEIMERNNKGIEKLLAGLFNSSNAFSKIAQDVLSLSDKSRKITKTVNTIEKVSIQTNMLAVNGFIEAAHSGEYGKGFSVVANDIRNLANESGENAEDIKELVTNIQYHITKVAADIESSAKDALNELNKSKESEKLIDVVKNVIKGLRDSFVIIGREIDQIAASIEQTSKAIEQINAAIEESASAIEEAAKAVKDQAEGVEELARTIEEIAAIADELQQPLGV